MIRDSDQSDPAPGAVRASGRTGDNEENESNFEDFLVAVASAPPVLLVKKLEPEDIFADRYRIERLLGEGGMGSVYLARDLQLDRNIALKLARGAASEADLARLQREALAMARLSHPGVVTVYEAGTCAGQVYIAMEFVPGSTLRDWLDLGPHPWKEVVLRFVSLARALGAAHEAGVVHRDFKPENVLLDLHGSPRVADFGVASLTQAVAVQARLQGGVEGPLTRTGAIVGTPAYMAPEQCRGEGETAASDQFSLCVTLFEALHGARPFTGRTPSAVLDAIETGALAPERTAVPAALRRVLRTGLADDPEHRHASMTVLAAELERVLRTRRRWALGAAGLVGVAAAATLGFASAVAVEPAACEDADRSIAELWNDNAHERLRAALQASSPAGEAAPIIAGLDAYAQDIAALWRETCEANRTQATLSDEDFGLRAACIERLEARMSGLMQQLHEDPARGYSPSVVGQTLPSPHECLDTATLRQAANRWSTKSLRDDAQADRAYLAALSLLSRAKVQVLVGHPQAADTLERLTSLAQTHALVDVAARVGLLRADLETDPAKRGPWLQAAARDASEAGDLTLAADVAVQRAQLALQSGAPAQAELHLSHADELTLLARAGGRPAPDPVPRTLVGAQLHLARGRSAEALEAASSSLASLDGRDPRRTEALALLASAQLSRNRLHEARASLLTVLATDPDGPGLRRYQLLLNLGIVERELGRLDAAAARFQDAESALQSGGEISPLTRARLLNNQGVVNRLRGDLEGARARQEDAAALIHEESSEHPSLAFVLDELGELDRRAGALDSAQARLAQSGKLRDAAYGPGNLAVSRTITLLARVLLDQGRPEPAIGAATTALEIQRAHGSPSDGLAETELELGRAQAVAGRLTEARAALQDAREHCEGSQRAACTKVTAEAQRLIEAPAQAAGPR